MTEQIGFTTKNKNYDTKIYTEYTIRQKRAYNTMIKNILNWLTPAADKTGHYFTGEYPASLSLIIYLILESYYNLPLWLTAITLLTLSVSVALWKEYVYDPKNGGKTEKLDAFFTILPAIRNLAFVIILKHLMVYLT